MCGHKFPHYTSSHETVYINLLSLSPSLPLFLCVLTLAYRPSILLYMFFLYAIPSVLCNFSLYNSTFALTIYRPKFCTCLCLYTLALACTNEGSLQIVWLYESDPSVAKSMLLKIATLFKLIFCRFLHNCVAIKSSDVGNYVWLEEIYN